MALVKIPDFFNSQSNERKEYNADGNSLREVIDSLEKQIPGIKEKLTEKGEVRHFINIYIDGEDTRFLEGLDTVVKPESKISILPAVAGG